MLVVVVLPVLLLVLCAWHGCRGAMQCRCCCRRRRCGSRCDAACSPVVRSLMLTSTCISLTPHLLPPSSRALPQYIESLLRKYVTEFVQCQLCKNVDTSLRKDNVSRLFFMDCKLCSSSRSVAPIKAGYHATGKGERKKAREAAH